jgi:predicted ribosomally synthesized peptide with SipW-like signal peptide
MIGLGTKIALGLAAAGTAAAMVAASSFALFTAQAQNQSNTFAAGTVSLNSTPATGECSISNMAPGDSSTGFAAGGLGYGNGGNGSLSDAPCTFDVTYTGSIPAWLGVSATVVEGSTPLSDLVFQITDNNGNTIADTGTVTQFEVQPNATEDITVNYGLPLSSTEQGGSVTLNLEVQAQQYANNQNPTWNS